MKKKLLLASGSPRRKEILTQAGFSFRVFPANADEEIAETDPEKIVMQLSERKARAAMELWRKQTPTPGQKPLDRFCQKPLDRFCQKPLDRSCQKPLFFPADILVLGADTIVALNQHILGKPADRTEAVSMLELLQGNTHFVYTGVTLLWADTLGNLKTDTFVQKTGVTFYPMTAEEIISYVQTGEGDDKAGAYAVQGLAMKYIRSIEGDYHNVVGLPAAAVYQAIKEQKLDLEPWPEDQTERSSV